MPQININEIDQSLYTRVTNNNLLKVFVPGIATFGPVYEGETGSAPSFTNKEAFRKVFGYNLPEQNPIKNDYSKLYAEQLLDNGAEVSFVRLNKGITATFDIGVTDPTNDTIDNRNITVAVRNSMKSDATPSNEYKFCTQITGIEAKYSGSFGNQLLVTIQPVNSANRAFTYQYANITVYKADFYEQTVKTGNNYVTTSKIKSVTKLENHIVSTNPYDTSYFEDVEFDFITIKTTPSARDEFTIIWSTLNGTYNTSDTILSGFPTINLKYKDNSGRMVYNEAALIGAPAEYPVVIFTGTGTTEDPYVPAYEANKYYQKNTDGTYTLLTSSTAPTDPPAWGTAEAFFTAIPSIPTEKGWDFAFSSELRNVLDTGFSGMTFGQGKYTVANVNDYLFECYAPQTVESVTVGGKTYTNVGGIVKDVYKNLVDCYANYTDPYIYDFDFITSGTLIDNEFTINYTDETNYDVVTFSGEGASLTPKYEANTYYTKNGSTYTLLTSSEAPSNWGTADTFYVTSYSQSLTPDATVEQCTTVFTKFLDNTITDFASITDINGDFERRVAGISALNAPTTLKATHIAMIELANTRQDCIALIDPCLNWAPESLVNYVGLINSSYATMHSPYCYVNSPVANELILMPPSYIFLMVELNMLITGTEIQKWFTPAGVSRASARMVVKPYYEIGSTILNMWQNENVSRVNPIMKLKSYGYVIYGNYTCRVADDLESFSALDSLNVRITANCVKKQIFNTCLTLTFEPNNSSLWMKFYDAMDKYLLFMKRNDGVYDYRIQMDESTVTTDDINQLRCPGKVWINPTRTAEFFDIDFTITEAGVTFSNTVGEGE